MDTVLWYRDLRGRDDSVELIRLNRRIWDMINEYR